MDTKALDQFLAKTFTEARTYYAWHQKPVADELLRQVYDIAKMGPTSANCCPLRILFVKNMASKEKLKPAMYEGNIEKTMTSPVTAIFAYDTEFYEKMSELFPHGGMQDLFKGNKELAHETAVRNSNLQAAYFMVVARALGLDCGPMSGFDKQKVDGIFFTNTSWRSNFLCNLGYGNSDSVKPRLPRLSFDTACQVI